MFKIHVFCMISSAMLFLCISSCFPRQVLLANKLDEEIKMAFIVVVSPLFVSFVTLILMSFSAKGGNKCKSITSFAHFMGILMLIYSGWFGMRKDFCSFVLGACPLLQEYANIAYNTDRRRASAGVELQSADKQDMRIKKADMLKPVLPIVSIEMPD